MSTNGVKAGNIYLDVNINQKGFKKQLNGIAGIAQTASAIIASDFVKKAMQAVVKFTKECIELGSDLEEVQNVVDVTFPTMSATIDKFAKDAAASFGLSETMAKKYAGTLGSMAEAFGFSESQAAEMATTLTGLAGDVASFYNLSQDEAYTKLKSVFTGETESLKDLGVVMTQTALDQYALANGFGKTTKSMSEAEKVALRYAFVQDQLANATGDFTRTSDSWANQTKVLQLRIESLKASIGQGLINLFKPILIWVNTIIAKLQVLADAFARFTSFFTKKDVSTSTVSSIAGELTTAASSADSVSSGLSGATSSAKALKRELAGFDKITKLSEVDTSAGSGGASGADTSSLIAGINDATTASTKAIEQTYPFIEKMQDIFGAGIKKASEDLKEFNNNKLSSIKDSLFEIAETAIDFKDAFVDVAEVLEGPAFSKIVTFFVKLNTATNLTVFDKVIGFAKDLFNFFVQPIIQNKGKLKEAWSNIFEIISLILKPLEKLIDFATSKSKKYEDSVIHKFMAQATSDNVQYMATFLDTLNAGLERIIGLLTGEIKLGDVLEDLFPFFFGNEKPNDIEVEFKAEIKQRWSELQSKWRNLTQNIKDKVAQFRAEIKQKWSDLQANWTALTKNIKSITAYMRAEVGTKWADLKSKWNDLISHFKDVKANILLNFSAAAQDLKNWINTNVIDRVNNKFKNVPILKNVKIPHLAQGGYVKANTPQLALIGDNRHQGEVVAPEGKLAELARKGAELAGKGGRDSEMVSLLRQILELLKTMNLTAYVDAEGLKKVIVRLINDNTRSTGKCELYV